jgi:hypothetical protein
LELCAITRTLVIDEDGCYDPSEFNDSLVLGMKGTFAQAELHIIRARLHGGKLNKARKGELKFPLPVGYVMATRLRSTPIKKCREPCVLSSSCSSAKERLLPLSSVSTSSAFVFRAALGEAPGTAN